MFEKNMKFAYLIDFYIDLFDEHSRDILKAYYDDDLSLAEIASGEGISRQGIRHIIKKCEEQLLFFEEKLGLSKKHAELEEASDKLAAIKKQILESDIENRDSIADSLDIAIVTILNKGV